MINHMEKCGERNEIIYNTEVSKSIICDYNDSYVLVRSDIIVAGRNLATGIAFKN